MPAATPVRPIEFRNVTLGATVAVLRETEPARLADALHTMLGGMPDFFNNEAAVLDFGSLGNLPDRIDWAGLTSLLRRYRLQPIGVLNLPADLAAAARLAGLAQLDAAELRERQPGPSAAPAPAAQPAARHEPPPPPPPPQAGTLIIDRPLRSGQQVYARGGDLVLLGGVSNGAEVIADGNIHCYGPLRGRALAGAQGNAEARVLALDFGPELVSIAGVYRTFENGIPANVAGRPAQVRLVGTDRQQTLGIEPLQAA